jgi:hypothetical protein
MSGCPKNPTANPTFGHQKPDIDTDSSGFVALHAILTMLRIPAPPPFDDRMKSADFTLQTLLLTTEIPNCYSEVEDCNMPTKSPT